MKRIPTVLIMTLLALSLLMAGCYNRSGNVYSPGQARVEHTVVYGKITDVRNVTMQAEQSGLGALGGAVVGGVLGSTMGRSSGKTLAVLGGAVLGGAAGAATEHAVGNKEALELTVEQDDGKIVTVVQEAGGEFFAVGDRVRVLRASDGSARVRH